MFDRLKPYWLHVYLLAYTPLVLFADSRVDNAWQQAGLGLLTLFLLFLCTQRVGPEARRQVWLCVGVATGFEIFGSLVWGVYRYRWHNLPLYVPPGHGLVYWFGLTAGATPVFQRYGRRAANVVLGAGAAWAVAGLTVLPLLTHRWDLQGAACLPLFAFAILRSPRYALFATIFLATTDLELAGTLFGDWAWQPVAPWTHLSSGNPPSAIAGGYCVIDGSVALVMGLLVRLGVWPSVRREAVVLPAAA